MTTTICQLCHKAFNNQMSVYILVKSVDQAITLDEMLWTHNDEAFLPHQNLLLQEDLPDNFFIPVIINGSENIPDGYDQVLINAGADVPAFYSRFDRVLEIVGKTEQEKSAARERFRFYRDRGYQLQQFDL